MQKESCFFLGKITKTHGLKGDVVVKLDTDTPHEYHKLESVFVSQRGMLVPFFVENIKVLSDPSSLAMKFENITLNETSTILGEELYLPLDFLPKLSGKQFYFHEVEGFTLEDKTLGKVGEILWVNDQTAQSLFVVKTDQEQEIYIPVIDHWLLQVNREQKTILMNLPEGLVLLS